MSLTAKEFLKAHGMEPERIDPAACSVKMAEHMRAGLEGNIIDMPMIPTYLSMDAEIPQGKKAVVIDAGGTNYRCGLAEFAEGECRVTNVSKCKMPGTGGASATWEEFVTFICNTIQPLLHEADVIGFCFSYSADILPDLDGRVHRIDKEVVIKGCEEQLIGASILAELKTRGIEGKKVVILNDTVAALLGGVSAVCRADYSDFIGMICGTGINTCAPVARAQITKLPEGGEGRMLINLESGCYSGLPAGDADLAVDAKSNIPGEKKLEKMCSGVYIGSVYRETMRLAVADGCLSEATGLRLSEAEKFDGASVNALACGENVAGIFEAEELKFAQEVAVALFERAANVACTNILAIMLLNDSGTDPEKPACVCAEGSLISHAKPYMPALQNALENGAAALGRYAKIVVGNETTLPGSAAAALLNA